MMPVLLAVLSEENCQAISLGEGRAYTHLLPAYLLTANITAWTSVGHLTE